MEILDDVIYFDSDDEFTDFCLEPYGILDSNANTYYGKYSDLYKKYLAEDKTFVIKDFDSKVSDRRCVCKRVPIKGTGIQPDPVRLVQMSVQNIEFFNPFFYRKRKQLIDTQTKR